MRNAVQTFVLSIFYHHFVGFKFLATPNIKAELSLFAGINWKLRATYILKSPISFSNDRDDLFNIASDVRTSLKIHDQFMISILVQSFSFRWD